MQPFDSPEESHDPAMMRPARQYRWTTPTSLKIALGLLMLLSVLELAFVSSTVAWLHNTASGAFAARDGSASLFTLRGEPATLLTDQGHTANAAAGTGLILIGFGGILTLGLRHHFCNKLTRRLYYLWVLLTPLALLLTLGALIFVLALTGRHSGQTIDADYATKLPNASGTRAVSDPGSLAKYPLEEWTPQGWFGALLKLNLVDAKVRSDVEMRLRIMNGWMWNLIPMFVVQLVQTALALADALRWRREWRKSEVREVRPGENTHKHIRDVTPPRRRWGE